jgi:hypothetical protein
VNYANSAGAVAWTGVSGRPTTVSAFTNDSGYYSNGSSPNFNNIVDNSGNFHLDSNGGHATYINWFAGSGGTIIGNGASGYGNISAAGFFYASDQRLKENVRPLDNALDIVRNLNGVRFDWKQSHQADVGFIAQEVEKVVPELVTTNRTNEPKSGEINDVKSVKYGNIVAIAIEGIKELDVQCKASKEQLQAMKENLERHERSIASLQSSDTLQNQELAKLKAENAELRGELDEIKQMLKSQKSGGESPSWFNDILKLLGLN